MSKIRIRLNDSEATALGFELKTLLGKGNPKYILSQHQKQLLNEIRSSGVIDACSNVGADPTTAPMLWLKTKKESVRVTNPLYVAPNQKIFNNYKDEIVKELKKYSPNFKKIKHKNEEDPHLLIIDIADLHINKFCEKILTGDNYNSNIAVQRALEGTKGLIRKASGFNIEKILFVIGNDVLNTDNILKGTTKGTIQDTDLHWLTAFNVAKDCYIQCIEYCVSVADVDIIHCPSNHDLMSGCFLAEVIHAWFRKCENITFNIGAKYRKYYKYYSNMIELEHGEKGKMINLPLTMAQEEPIMWAETKFRYGYLHHFHHLDKTQFKTSKDYIGANITYLRSPSSADIWHADSQYLNLVAVEGFIHSRNNGRVSHITHYF
jgi:hypothetical protein